MKDPWHRMEQEPASLDEQNLTSAPDAFEMRGPELE